MEIHEADQSSRQARTMSEIHLVPGLLTGLEYPRVPPGMAVWSLPFWWNYVTFSLQHDPRSSSKCGEIGPADGLGPGGPENLPCAPDTFLNVTWARSVF